MLRASDFLRVSCCNRFYSGFLFIRAFWGLMRKNPHILFLIVVLAVLSSLMTTNISAESPAAKEAGIPAAETFANTWAKAYGTADTEYLVRTSLGTNGNLLITSRMYSEDNFVDDLLIELDANGDVESQHRLKSMPFGTDLSDLPGQWLLTSDGGTLLVGAAAGSNNNLGYSAARAIKFDAAFNIEWQHSYGVTKQGTYDEFFSAVEVSDGYVVTGTTDSYSEYSTDVWVVKLDFNGTIVWQKYYNARPDDEPIGNLRKNANNDGFVMTGVTDRYDGSGADAFIMQFDANGKIQWQTILGGPTSDRPRDIVQAQDGGYLMVGTRYLNNRPNGWLVKLDSAGKVQWQKTYSSKKYTYIQSALALADGSYMLVGVQTVRKHHTDGWLAHVNGSGIPKWEVTYGGEQKDSLNSILPGSDGGYLLAGETQSFGAGNTDIWILSVDAKGQLIGKCIQSGKPKTTVTASNAPLINVKLKSQESKAVTGSLNFTKIFDISNQVATQCPIP